MLCGCGRKGAACQRIRQERLQPRRHATLVSIALPSNLPIHPLVSEHAEMGAGLTGFSVAG